MRVCCDWQQTYDQLHGILVVQGTEQRAVNMQLAFSFTLFIPLRLPDHETMLFTFKMDIPTPPLFSFSGNLTTNITIPVSPEGL